MLERSNCGPVIGIACLPGALWSKSDSGHSPLMSGTCRVLIIEDKPLIAMQVRQVLEGEGANSFAFAVTQEGAVAAAVSHPPDFITSDVELINGPGPLAVSAIHWQLGDVPVVFITATRAGCAPCAPPGKVLCKPLDETELANVFHQLVEL